MYKKDFSTYKFAEDLSKYLIAVIEGRQNSDAAGHYSHPDVLAMEVKSKSADTGGI